MKISERLKAISDFIDETDRVIDIGCDHANLDIYLCEQYKSINIIASDIHEGALKQALSNIERDEKMNFERGEIFEYEEVNKGIYRKALILSADFRTNDRWQSIILLNEEPKGQINVPIVCGEMMYADCGVVSFGKSERFGNFICRATSDEMKQIDEGIAKCLGLEMKDVGLPTESIAKIVAPMIAEPSVEVFSEELATAKAEANIYKDLYEKLLAKVMG